MSHADIKLNLGGQITGRVTISNETPGLEGVVQAEIQVDSGWQMYQRAPLDTDGNFVLKGLPSGAYRLQTSGRIQHGAYFSGYYGGAERDEALSIVLTDSAMITVIQLDIAVPDYNGVIEGRVTVNDVGLPGIRVEFDRAADESYRPFLYAYTDADGHYRMEGLSNQCDYCIRVVDPEQKYATMYYGVNPQGLYCDRVKIPDDNLSPNNDIAVVEGGGISGTIQFGSGQPVADVTVIVFRRDLVNSPFGDSDSDRLAQTLMNTETDKDGHYLITGLIPGEYQLKFIYNYRSEYYGYTDNFRLAKDIPVRVGQITQDINLIYGLNKKNYLPMVLVN